MRISWLGDFWTLSDAKEELSHALLPSKRERIFGFFKWLIIAISVVLLGIYTGTFLFGSRSLEVLMKLQDEQDHLVVEIEKLKNENAAFQKEGFEYEQLQGKKP